MSKVNISEKNAVRVMNKFRMDNPNYTSRLPEATLQNVREVGGMIANNDVMFNDFVRVIGKVAETYVRTPQFKNLLGKNKLSVSQYGDKIEEIFVGLVESTVFRSESPEKTLFKKEKPNVQAVYFSIEREDQYKTTTDDIEMKKAMKEEGGVSKVLSAIIGSMDVSNEWDEYLLMKALIEGSYAKDEPFLVAVGDVKNNPDKMKEYIIKVRQYMGDVQFMNRWNAKGVLNSSTLESMTHYIPNGIKARADVEVLAKAYNLGQSDIVGREINIDRFDDPNIVAVSLDDSFFIVADVVKQLTTQVDEGHLTTNHFLTIIQYIARSPFATNIAFVQELPEGREGKLLLDKPIALVDKTKSLEIKTNIIPYDGSTMDLSDYTIEATVDTTGVDVVVDEKTITLTPNGSVEGGESFVLSVTATHNIDQTIKTKGNYTITRK